MPCRQPALHSLRRASIYGRAGSCLFPLHSSSHGPISAVVQHSVAHWAGRLVPCLRGHGHAIASAVPPARLDDQNSTIPLFQEAPAAERQATLEQTHTINPPRLGPKFKVASMRAHGHGTLAVDTCMGARHPCRRLRHSRFQIVNPNIHAGGLCRSAQGNDTANK